MSSPRPGTLKDFLRSRNGLIAGVGVAAVLIAVGLIVASQVGSGGGGSKQGAPNLAGVAETASLFRGVPQSGTALGSPHAPVTLVEFADLQCPWCREYAIGALPTIVSDYVRTGKVRVVFNGMDFVGPDSVTALRTALAAGLQNRLWNVIDLLYRNQGTENTGWVTEDLLRAVGNAVPGLDTEKMLGARQSSDVDDAISEAAGVASTEGVNSTPTFFAGRTGGSLQPLVISSPTPDAVRQALAPLVQ